MARSSVTESWSVLSALEARFAEAVHRLSTFASKSRSSAIGSHLGLDSKFCKANKDKQVRLNHFFIRYWNIFIESIVLAFALHTSRVQPTVRFLLQNEQVLLNFHCASCSNFRSGLSERRPFQTNRQWTWRWHCRFPAPLGVDRSRSVLLRSSRD